jgi:hypothetical protein
MPVLSHLLLVAMRLVFRNRHIKDQTILIFLLRSASVYLLIMALRASRPQAVPRISASA